MSAILSMIRSRYKELGISAGELQRHRAAWIAPMMLALVGAGIVVLLAFAHIYGRDARVIAERAEMIVVERENGAFCAGLGLAARTDTYTRCMNGLTDIRRRQDERRSDDAMGIL